MSDTSHHTFEAESLLAQSVGSRYRGPHHAVFVVNNDWWFLSHRATWGLALQSAGSRVSVIAEDTGKADTLRRLGFDFIDVGVGREATGVFSMLRSASAIFMLLLRLRPNVVFLTAQAAYTLGWPAAIFLPKTHFIRIVSGIGRALDPDSLKKLSSRVVRISGRLAARLPNIFTLFQVQSDRNTFSQLGLISRDENSLLIPGTGIAVDAWDRARERNFDKPVILFASRLFREKGVWEFVQAAEILRSTGWQFWVAGDPDPGVETSVSQAQLAEWGQRGTVTFLGRRNDMANVLGAATLFVLPTRHPEGTPKVLIEAGASGLPAVVSGQPGCEAVVADGITGIVLDRRPTAEQLAEAIALLSHDAEKASAMGRAAQELIRTKFSLECVLRELLEWRAVGAVRS